MTQGLGFTDRKVMAELTAKMLLEVEAVRFMEDKPFIFTSGWASPVYTDCRRLISFPRVRKTLIDFGAATVLRDAGFEPVMVGPLAEAKRFDVDTPTYVKVMTAAQLRSALGLPAK